MDDLDTVLTKWLGPDTPEIDAASLKHALKAARTASSIHFVKKREGVEMTIYFKGFSEKLEGEMMQHRHNVLDAMEKMITRFFVAEEKSGTSKSKIAEQLVWPLETELVLIRGPVMAGELVDVIRATVML